MGTAITELGNLNAMAVIGSQDGRGLVLALNHQRQDRCGYYNGHESQSHNQNTLTHANLWHWLIDHGVSRNEIDRKLSKLLLGLYRQKSSRSSTQI